MRHLALTSTLLFLLAGCHAAGTNADMPGDSKDHRPYAEIGEGETLRFTGTEPFWGGEVTGGTLTYKTPETPDGQSIAVSRFAGRGGISWSGMLDGTPLALVATPGACSDGMSDRRYAFIATLRLGEQTRDGCAWSDAHPFTKSKAP